jgi:hypothetical protein
MGPLERGTRRRDGPGTVIHRGKDMKKAIVTGAAVLTTLGGATAVSAATALPAAAGSGCGVTIKVHNLTNSAIKGPVE